MAVVFNICLDRKKAITEKTFKSFDSRTSSLNYSTSCSYATSVIRENFSLPFNVWQNQQSSEKCQIICDFGSECSKLLFYVSLVQSQEGQPGSACSLSVIPLDSLPYLINVLSSITTQVLNAVFHMKCFNLFCSLYHVL